MTPRAGVEANWIVDDSEDEFSMEVERPGLDAQSSRIQSAAAIETSTIPIGMSPIETAPQPRVDAGGQSTISSFSAPLQKAGEQSTISSYTPAAGDTSSSSKPSKPRPRPRPAFKGARSDTTAPTSDPSALQTPSSDRLLPPTIVVDSNTELPAATVTGQDTADFPQDIAERAKMRSRKPAIPYREEIVIDLSSDDEIALPPAKPKTKPKPKPKPRPAKRAKTDHPNPGDVSIAESETVTIPVASSSFPLPPSDPLPPTPPPKRVVPDQGSSPMVSPVRKRKRKAMRIDDDSDGGEAGNAPMDIDKDTRTMPPPELPRFFAGSSTSDDICPSEEPVASSDKTDGKTKKVVEDTPAKPKKTKSKATKKKPSVEVVIKSPAKGKGKGKSKSTEDDLPVKTSGKSSEKTSAGLDDDAYLSAVDDSQGEDELQLLPPKSKAKAKKPPSSSRSSDGPKSGKGKQKAVAPSDADARPKPRARGGKRGVVLSDEEEDVDREVPPQSGSGKNRKSSAKQGATIEEEESDKPVSKSSDDIPAPKTPAQSKENVHPKSPDDADGAASTRETPARETSSSSARVFTRGYTFSRPAKATPMQELIRRATSHPNSPFQPSPKQSPYNSPLFKTTKSALRKIAPLHPNRRTPPPPLPPPPAPKKSKKMLDLEEKWEMELEDEVPGWWSLTDEERKEWRRAKKDKELGFED